MLSQAKIDLAVLLKLFQHSEANGQAVRSSEICFLFKSPLPARRVELALEALESRREAENHYHPLYPEGAWQISRSGIQTVENALRNPTTFIARLNSSGDLWLQSDEAKRVKLARNPRYPNSPLRKFSFPESSEKQLDDGATVLPTISISEQAHPPINWTKWGTIIGAIGLLVPIIAMLI